MGKGTNNPTDIKSEIKFRKLMRKPSRKKHFGQHLAYKLYYVNPESINRKAYQRSIYCSDSLIPTKDGNLMTHRCRCRWCPMCASIQTAKLIAGYGPQLNYKLGYKGKTSMFKQNVVKHPDIELPVGEGKYVNIETGELVDDKLIIDTPLFEELEEPKQKD